MPNKSNVYLKSIICYFALVIVSIPDSLSNLKIILKSTNSQISADKILLCKLFTICRDLNDAILK
jgi:hypothetical protein